MKVNFVVNNDLHRIECIIKVKDKEFMGYALCHPNDNDYYNERTGKTIAEARAMIKYQQYLKAEERTKLHALYEVRRRFKLTNRLSHEYVIITKFIHEHEERLNEIINAIQENRDFLYSYINEKDKLYKRLREIKK